MANVLIVAYLLIVLALIGVILLQRSEGGGLGMGYGAGGEAMDEIGYFGGGEDVAIAFADDDFLGEEDHGPVFGWKAPSPGPLGRPLPQRER